MTKQKTADRSPVEEYLDVEGAPTPKGQRTRARILASARRNLEERGYFEATVTEITSGSDVALGTFYRYFTNKEEAFMVVLEHLVVELHQAAGGTWDAEDPLASLEEATRRYLTAYRDNGKLVSALLQMSVAVPECEAKWAELRQMTYERMARHLPEEIDGIEAEIAIPALADMVEQFARRWYVSAPVKGKRAPSIDRAARTLALVWYRALYEDEGRT